MDRFSFDLQLFSEAGFNWNNVGYFSLDDAGGMCDGIITVARQEKRPELEEGRDYLEVTSTMDEDGVATITGMRVISPQSDGSLLEKYTLENTSLLEEYTWGNTYGSDQIRLNAEGLKGVALCDHAPQIVIMKASDGSEFTGLNLKDEIDCATIEGKITLNDKEFSVKAGTISYDGKEFMMPPNSDPNDYGHYSYLCIIRVDGTVVSGTFILNRDCDELTTILDEHVFYTDSGDGDGARVVVGKIDGIFDGKYGERYGAILEVTGLAKDGEKVVVEKAGEEGAEPSQREEIWNENGVIMKTFCQKEKGTNIRLKAVSVEAGKNLLEWSGFQFTDGFGFGETETGLQGGFELGENGVETQTVLQKGKSYAYVSATKGADGYTIDKVKFVDCDSNGLGLLDPDYYSSQCLLTVVAPPDGNLKNESGHPINVIGAQAGYSYTGFREVSCTLAAGETITVGGTTYKAAADDAFVFGGLGDDICNGTVFVGNWCTYYGLTGDQRQIQGSENAVVQFRDREIAKISGLQNGETITIRRWSGVYNIWEYKAEAVPGSDALKITRTVKDFDNNIKDQATYTVPDASANILNPKVVFESKFDWTVANGDGYFPLGDYWEIKPTTTVVTDAVTDLESWISGRKRGYLKVSLASDGEISGLAMMKLNADGSFSPDADEAFLRPLNITAPTDIGLKFDVGKFDLLEKVRVNITGAQKGSVINGLRDIDFHDSLQTATLTAGDTITVNGETYTAGAKGVLKFTDGRLESGVIQFTDNDAIAILYTNSLFLYNIDANGDVITVKVVDGKVTEISGLKNGSFRGDGGTYTKTGVKFEDVAGLIETLSLAEGQTVEFTAGRDDEYDSIYTAGADGAMKFLGGNYTAYGSDGTFRYQMPKLVKGTLKFTDDTTDKTVQMTAGQRDSSANNHDDPNDSAIFPYVSTGQYSVATNGDTVVVKVQEGKITDISGLKNGTVTFTDTNGNMAVYDVSGVAFTTIASGTSIEAVALAEGVTVKVGEATYTAGAKGALKFYKDKDAKAQLVEGTLKFTADATIQTSRGRYSVAANANGDAVIVKVQVGKVASISGLQDGKVTFTDENGNVAVYDASGVVFAAPAIGTTVQTAVLTEGQTVKVGKAAYTAGAKGALKFFVDEDAKAQVINGALKLAAGGNVATKSGVAVKLSGTETSNVFVTVQQGKVSSITGLKKGDTITVGTTSYKAISDTVIARTDGTKDAGTTRLDTAGGNILGAKYAKDESGTGVSNAERQFSWTDVSGRSSGFFEVKAGQAKVAEQKEKVKATAPKDTVDRNGNPVDNSVIYAVANTATDEDDKKRQTLTIGTLKANTSKAGVTTITDADAKTLLKGVTLNVTAPTAKVTLADGTQIVPALTYAKGAEDTFHIKLDKVAAGSVVTGLDIGDTVKTATLAIGEKVTMQGVDYVAGVKGALNFIGEGKDKIALQRGTVLLDAGKSAILSGATNGTADDVTVTADGLAEGEYVTVTVKDGVVKSITGLRSTGATVTIGSATYAVKYSEEVKAGLYATMIERSEGGKKTYASLTNQKDFYAASSYSAIKEDKAETPTNTESLWGKGKKSVYVEWSGGTATLEQKDEETIDARTAERGKWYVVVTADTNTNGVTTISKLEMAQINEKGIPTRKGKTPDNVVIDGTIGESSFAKITYTIPKAMRLTAAHVALGSKLTDLKDGDKVTTETTKGSFAFSRNADKVIVYKAGTTRTETTTYTCKTAGVTATMTGGVLSISGFNKGTLTVVSTTEADGRIQTDYTWKYDARAKKNVLTKTVTAPNGAKKDYVIDETNGVADGLIGAKFKAADTINQVVSDFDWTMAKNKTGYFAVSGKEEATAKAQTVKTTIKDGKKNYIAVTLSADGTVSFIGQKSFDKTATGTDGMVNTAGEKFAGTLTVAASAKAALRFDRSALDAETIDAKAKVSVTGAIAGSAITGLTVGDKVVTAKLVYNAKTGEGARITVGDKSFEVGATSPLSFLVQDLGGAVTTITGGTIKMDAESGSVYIGKKCLMVTKGDMTLAVSGNGTSYTFKNLKEGAIFTVKDFDKKTLKTYRKSSSTLFCTTVVYDADWKNPGTPITSVVAAGASIANTILDDSDNSKSRKGWTVYSEGDTVHDVFDGDKLVNGRAVMANLATLDKRIAADKADAGSVGYEFVIDQYMAAPKNFKGAASVIAVGNEIDAHRVVGTVTDTYVYKAAGAIAQTVNATNGWTVIGSDEADVIVGAAKGSDTLNGGAGNDTVTGGGANDVFEFGAANDNDVVKSYTTGKDKITVAYAGFGLDKVALVSTKVGRTNTANVLLHDGSYKGKDEDGNILATNSIFLSGMGNGKTVTINGKTYYFGSAAMTKGMTFSYVEGAYYLGREEATTANTLRVTTDKSKAMEKALGDTVKIDLSDKTHYKNINAIDASKSGNILVLTAADSGSTLKGGTYQTTLKGGDGKDSLIGGSKGNDVFWFDTVKADDVVSGYTSGKDSVYLGGKLPIADGMTVEAKGSDVVIRNGDTGSVTLQKAADAKKAITVRKDAEGSETLSYYVGKATGKNNFVATVGADTETDDKGNTVFKSYYVGSAAAAATDTLTITTAKGAAAQVLKATFSLRSDKHLSAIDAIDASSVSAAENSEIAYEGKNSGIFTLKGSKSANVKETFDLSHLTDDTDKDEKQKNKITLTNLDVNDVLELAEGLKLVKAGKVGQYYIKNATENQNYGILTFTGATKHMAWNDPTTSGGKVHYELKTK